jgi:hypothetical protein
MLLPHKVNAIYYSMTIAQPCCTEKKDPVVDGVFPVWRKTLMSAHPILCAKGEFLTGKPDNHPIIAIGVVGGHVILLRGSDSS